ncbi:MAG TPA: glutamate 5-kinase [Chitinophagaceae bacterium]
MQKARLVIKLGSAIITNSKGEVDEAILQKLAGEVAVLMNTWQVVLVSSGAVASGKAFIHQYKGTLTERKAAAAVGNPLLVQLYHRYFSAYGITIAQALCERHHFSNRPQFLQLKETFLELWANNILPVVNENDLVSNVELKFSDNDELATLIAVGLDADTLLICTSAGGFLDGEKNVIPQVETIDSRILGYVNAEKSAVGLGGMLSKLTFTRLATSLGIRVIISGLAGERPVQEALEGQKGTIFKAQVSNLKARQKWLASGSITIGSIVVDEGAEKALHDRRSLLAVGVSKAEGVFLPGEVVQLVNKKEEIIGVAKVRLGTGELMEQQARRGAIAAHADDIVLF